ncbi:hypothetical protein GQX73_g2668 [Xylaria multiplex]|uniref:HMG box domain-containing protein n=1 Tax=Xylaria multiplex TaxID=323545 RepID=A0A7C8NAX0_9PEZI|nr:hypothetical protein GQX73_g2668 [Xylaria multiplex]
MLSSIGRLAAGRLVSTALATSSTGSVVFRATPKLRFKVPGIYGSSRQAIRGLASVAQAKKASPSASAKKTATKKTATKKPVKKTTAAKAKAKAKAPAKTKAKTKAKAKAKAKPKAKPRTKRPISEKRQALIERRTLRKAALFTEPKLLASQPWQLFIVEKTQGKGSGNAAQKMVTLAPEYKALPPSEIQRLESAAAQNKVANAATYKAWVESHSAQDIYDANLARRALKRKYNIPKGLVKTIRDDRIPKRPASAFSLFTKARWASGEYSSVSSSITEVGSKIAQEWKNITEAERKPYEDLAQSEAEHYQKAVGTILDRKRA